MLADWWNANGFPAYVFYELSSPAEAISKIAQPPPRQEIAHYAAFPTVDVASVADVNYGTNPSCILLLSMKLIDMPLTAIKPTGLWSNTRRST